MKFMTEWRKGYLVGASITLAWVQAKAAVGVLATVGAFVIAGAMTALLLLLGFWLCDVAERFNKRAKAWVDNYIKTHPNTP